MIESSYNSFLAGHQILVQKRRRFQINRRFASTYKESLTIRMSAENSVDTVVEDTSPTLPGIAESIVQRQPTTVSTAIKTGLERRNSRESSEGDLVHVSEVSSINNGGNSPPQSGEATPISSENQQVDLKFERRDSQDKSSAVVNKPHLAPKQRHDVKEPGYDEIEDTIQVKSTCMLTKKREFDDEKHEIKFTAQTATGFALLGVLVGTYIYFKYR